MREVQRIAAPVVFLKSTVDTPQDGANSSETEPNEFVTADDDDFEDLVQSEHTIFVNIIRELRSELRRNKNSHDFFDTTSQRIAQQRDAVVTILDFTENIAAIKSSLDELDTKSIAASAQAEWIDSQWQQHITNQSSQAWWTSDKTNPFQVAAKQRRRAASGTQDTQTPPANPDCGATRALPAPSPKRPTCPFIRRQS